MKYLSCYFLLLFCSLTGAFAQPRITLVGDTLVDFGAVYRGDKVTRTASVINAGVSDLVIEKAVSSCGCTTVSVDKQRLVPGDTAKLLLTFNSNNFIGEVKKFVLLVSNDSARLNYSVPYAANVVNVLQVNPLFIYFNGVTVGEKLSKTLWLKNTTATPIQIKKISSVSGMAVCTLSSSSVGSGDSTMLQVIYTPASEGVVKDFIRIDTDHPLQPFIRIAVTSNVLNKK